MFLSFTVIMDPTINLMSRPYYKYKRRKHYSPCSRVPKNYLYVFGLLFEDMFGN